MRKNPNADIPLEKQVRPDAAVLRSKLQDIHPENTASATGKPIVTVVTAVFNAVKGGRKEELLQCLDSVQAQTGTTIEHLVIDGASADGTVELIRGYQNKNVPIRLLSEPDTGIYDAMNRGVWLARGKYVIFLNSDDYYSDPRGLAESVKALEESGADFSYAPITVLDEKTNQPVEHLLNHPNVNIIFLEMPFSHQSIMLRREAMREINGFDLRYRSGADYDSILRLIFTGHRACYVPLRFVAFRLGGYSFVNMTESQEEVGTIFSRLYKKYLDVDLTPEEGTRIYLTKQGPKELRQRQFHFAKAAFGDVIEPDQKQDDDFIPEDLQILQYHLQVIHHHSLGMTTLRMLGKILRSTPLLFLRFLLKYFALCWKLPGKRGAKQAFLNLVDDVQKERKKNTVPPKKEPPAPSPFYRLGVTCRDYWCTNGLYEGEQWGSWTGKKFSVFFRLPDSHVGKTLTAKIHLGGYVFPASPKRTVEIIVNGQKTGDMVLENFMPQEHRFSIPADAVSSPVLDVDFIADQAFSPKSLGFGEDTRELGMTFQKFSLEKEGELTDPSRQKEIKVGFLNHYNKWWVGGITYFKNLFQAMATTESPHLRPFIFPSPDKLADCLLPYVSALPVQPLSAADANHLPAASDYQVDILSHLNGNQVSEGCDGIAWIADFQHVHLPEMFDEQEIAFRNHSFHSLIDRNRIVCVSSYDAMEDFKNYAPESAHKARCLHFVSIPETEVYQTSEKAAEGIRRDRKLPERYFYVPNQFWKHKNHITVLKAVSILKKSGLPVHVVFSGNTTDARFPHYFEELEAFCRQEGIMENVHFLGLIPLKEVYFLMRDCIAMINPSKFEGWSSSVEEAKSIGKTIFLSNLNVHYEQKPPHGVYFPCEDPDWLADILKRAWRELKPGPDAEMEQKAREQLPVRIRQFGKDFQRIVLDALENRGADEAQAETGPQVTVITVLSGLRKDEKRILRNLESVAAQTQVSAEHLITANCSGDEIPDAVRQYADKFGCRLLTGPDHGIFGAMNLGTIHARGKYVAYLDPDSCYKDPDFLSLAVNAMDRENSDFAYVPVQNAYFAEMPFALPSMLFLRKALYSVAVFNDTFRAAGGYDLIFRLLLAGKRGVRIESSGADSSAENMKGDLVRMEFGSIFSRLSGRLGCAVTPGEGCRMYMQKQLPEGLRKLLQEKISGI